MRLSHRVDCKSDKQLCKILQITHHPTYTLYDNGKMREKYNGAKTEPRFVQFLMDLNNPTSPPLSSSSSEASSSTAPLATNLIQIKNDLDFRDIVIQQSTPILVAFHAPWFVSTRSRWIGLTQTSSSFRCKHCKKLEAEMSSVGLQLAREKSRGTVALVRRQIIAFFGRLPHLSALDRLHGVSV